MIRIKFISLIAAIFFFSGTFLPNVSAQIATNRPTVFQKIARVEGAKLTLEADLTTIAANRKSNDYFPGALTLDDGTQFKIDIKSRGKYRRRIAEIPPLKLKFKKKALAQAGLDTLNELKLVLPCYNNELGDELVVKEYIAYRMFEKLAGVSMKVQLIRLNLRDKHVENASKRSVMAILLEDEEEMAARLNAQLIDQFGTPVDSLVTNQVSLMVMFQYMIGNTDWDIAMNRNVRLLRSPVTGKIMTVPYDFDFSGIVSAPYASPATETGLKNVQDRFLMSSGLKIESLRKATQIIRSAKKEIYDLCYSKYLSRTTIDEMHHYLDTFFQHIEERVEVAPILRIQPTD